MVYNAHGTARRLRPISLASIALRSSIGLLRKAKFNTDADGKQMLLDIARLYTQTALHIEARQASVTFPKIGDSRSS
jgi:hypothetical protein